MICAFCFVEQGITEQLQRFYELGTDADQACSRINLVHSMSGIALKMGHRVATEDVRNVAVLLQQSNSNMLLLPAIEEGWACKIKIFAGQVSVSNLHHAR